jgi:rhodanese-related sulfurtransferase
MIRTPSQLCMIAICAGVFATGSEAAAQQGYPDFVTDFVEVARLSVETTDMQGYLEVVENPGDALILDVREPSEWQSGHVPGSVNVPRGVLEWRVWAHVGFPDNLRMDRTIYVQCRTGARATLAAKRLQELGLRNVVAVVADIREWEEAGHPFVTPG